MKLSVGTLWDAVEDNKNKTKKCSWYINELKTQAHMHTHNQASTQTCESSLTSINVKECCSYFAPLSIKLLKSLSPENHHTRTFPSFLTLLLLFHCTRGYPPQRNQISSSWSIQASSLGYFIGCFWQNLHHSKFMVSLPISISSFLVFSWTG